MELDRHIVRVIWAGAAAPKQHANAYVKSRSTIAPGKREHDHVTLNLEDLHALAADVVAHEQHALLLWLRDKFGVDLLASTGMSPHRTMSIASRMRV